jgi:peptidoglycan lytic transglycosylase A
VTAPGSSADGSVSSACGAHDRNADHFFFGQVHQTMNNRTHKASSASRIRSHIDRSETSNQGYLGRLARQGAAVAKGVAAGAALAAVLAGCVTAPRPVTPPPELQPPPEAKPRLVPDRWSSLPGWEVDALEDAWPAFLRSCGMLKSREGWQQACDRAKSVNAGDRNEVRAYFELQFTPWRVVNDDATESGLVTGYYEPLVRGSRKASARYRYPIYGVPDDLLAIELGEQYPQLKGLRLRGRLDGRKVVPYFDRNQIDTGVPALSGLEIAWTDDALDLFFLQVQGSGRVRLETGEILRVGYADQNGYPYRSIGKLLVDRGELTVQQASLQGIKTWATQNPDKVRDLLDHNASYVFFRELPSGPDGPLGAMGLPLTAGRSVAIDPRTVPLGAPVFLATTFPSSDRALARLMLAQDTGGAIKGGVRADFFWGFGEAADRQAGRMRQQGRMWVLLPNRMTPPASG